VKETEAMTGQRARTDEEAVAAGRELLESLQTRAILVTRGERGMTLVERDGAVTHIPTFAKDVFDVTGAGDTAISVSPSAHAKCARCWHWRDDVGRHDHAAEHPELCGRCATNLFAAGEARDIA
jgi:bifunctional ADP-heptose synthase (sugar kinase/adenylyltransferase)